MKKSIYIIMFIGVSLLGRIYYLSEFSDSPLFGFPTGPDVEEYDSWARSILAGQVIWSHVHIHAPVYPYFLAVLYYVFSLNFFWIRLFQLVLNLLPAILVFDVLIDYNKNDKVDRKQARMIGIVFLVIYALYPPLMFYQAELVSESLVFPLLAASIYFIYKAEKFSTFEHVNLKMCMIFYMISGVFCGLSVITHPFSLFFLAGEIVYLGVICGRRKSLETRIQRSRKLLPLVVFASFAIVLIVPICIYNSVLEKRFVLVQKNSGFNLYLGNNINATGTCYLRPGPDWDRVHAMGEEEGRKRGLSKDQYFSKQAVDFMVSHPFSYILLLCKKAVYAFNYRELTAGADVGPIRYFTPFQRCFSWSFGAVAVIALFGVFMGITNTHFWYKYRHFLILFFSLWVGQILLVTSGRYRIPMIMAVFVFASYGVVYVVRHLRCKKHIPLMLLTLFISSVFVFAPKAPVDMGKERAEAATLYGEAYYKMGSMELAEEQLNYSLTLLNNWSRTYSLLGMVYEKKGALQQAVAAYEKAIALNPKSSYAMVNLGQLYSLMKQYDKAESLFKDAVSLTPDSPHALYNYGCFLQRKGEEKEALKMYGKCLGEDPAYVEALNNCGIIFMTQNRFEDAVSMFKKAVLLSPRNSQRLCNLAVAYHALGNQEESRYYAEKAISVSRELAKHPAIQQILGKD